MENQPPQLTVKTKAAQGGLLVEIDGKEFKLKYPKGIWESAPASVQQTLMQNLSFGYTHFLPIILNKPSVSYDFSFPLLESFFFKNQLYDLPSCEKGDGAPPLKYVRDFFNLDLKFKREEGALPDFREISVFKNRKPRAVLPFTFGKESLVSLALCRQLDIEPIVVYSQEPSHPHEEAYKREKLRELAREFDIPAHFVQCELGLLRDLRTLEGHRPTNVGWGSQTTLLALMSVPFLYHYQAQHLFFGSEYLNNEFEMREGWRSFNSYDQTSFWTHQQNNIIRLLTGGQSSLNSILEPIEEINIFHLLHSRFPELGRYQFSCSAEDPLYQNTQWCHQCYKCVRMYLFALCCEIDPARIGFKKNLLDREDLFEHYFGSEFKTGALQDLDFAFYILHKKGFNSPLIKRFSKSKLPHLKPWSWYRDYYTSMHPEENLPTAYRQPLYKIFRDTLSDFDKILPNG